MPEVLEEYTISEVQALARAARQRLEEQTMEVASAMRCAYHMTTKEWKQSFGRRLRQGTRAQLDPKESVSDKVLGEWLKGNFNAK